MGKEARRKRDKKKAKKAKQAKKVKQGAGRRTYDLSDETMAALRRQRQAFEERFGRPPGPDDPLLFDPDLDIPTAITPVKMEAAMTDVLTRAGIDPAFIYAHQHTGLLLTEENVDLVSDADRQEWADAIDRYHRAHPQPVDDDDIRAEIRQLCAMMVDLIVTDNGEAFFKFVEMLPSDEDDDGLTVALMMATLMGWLVGARDFPVEHTTIDHAIEAAQELAPALAENIDAVAGLLRSTPSDMTVNDMVEKVGDGQVLIVTMMILTASLVTAAGYGSIDALRDDLELP